MNKRMYIFWNRNARTSDLLYEKRPGTYVTADKGLPVFRSETKFGSEGWPSYDVIEKISFLKRYIPWNDRKKFIKKGEHLVMFLDGQTNGLGIV